MKFGELKSKIETYLTESYKKGTLKDNLFIFEQLVLKNKKVSQIFFLYDQLSEQKGMDNSIANEFINESITSYENNFNKIKELELRELSHWVGHVVCENKYKSIDDLFSNDVLTLENKIRSKKIILENLKSKKVDSKETIKVPLKTMVNVANKTVENFISTLDLQEQKELKKILNTPKETLVENYIKQKEIVLEKLEAQKNKEEDAETIKTIDEVLNKIQTEQFSELNLFKLKQLNEGL